MLFLHYKNEYLFASETDLIPFSEKFSKAENSLLAIWSQQANMFSISGFCLDFVF